MTCAIIVQIKNENRYLDEWISYHINIGVNHIYIIDNNNIDGEDPHDIIDKYNDYITYINDRGDITPGIHQLNYINTYHEYNTLYDWYIFIDIDEFIVLKSDNNINNYLSRDIFYNVDQIHLNWVIYDDNNLIYDDKFKSVKERFTHRMEPDLDVDYPLYNIGKPIIRGGLHIDEHRFHNIINFNNPLNTVDNIGNIISQEVGASEHNEDLCYISHYMTKSLEEFINKKYNQEDESHSYKYDFEKGYFIINKHTLEKDNYIKNYLNSIENTIGIFYIATGTYKKYFNNFAKSLVYLFPNNKKKLIVISDGLKEYDNCKINNIDVIVEDFIDYPYPFINTNKLQIINHYAKKYNISTIAYFDADTEIIKNEQENFYDNLLEISKTKFISTIPPYFIKFNINDLIYAVNNCSFFGSNCKFSDFEFLGIGNLIEKDYKWMQTSFFICTYDILNNISNKVRQLICYNSRIMGYKFNYSEELYVNYLNLYYPELFHIDYYWYDSNDPNVYNNYTDKKYRINVFFKQKFYNDQLKQNNKCIYDNYAIILNNAEINDKKIIDKFLINHTNEFIYISYGKNDLTNNIFLFCLNLNNQWYDGLHNIMLCKEFYSNDFLWCYDKKENANVIFINKIDDETINFNYKFLYNNDYDYINEYSLDDLKNVNFYDIKMCYFSKRYINAYFNNDKNFKPKIYNKE